MLELRDVEVASTLGRRRGSPTLDRAETDKALAFVKECCSRQHSPVRFLCAAMGCSARTARRILAKDKPYASLLKRAYAAAFSRSVGHPLEVVTQPADITYATALRGWTNDLTASLATRTAAHLGAGIATRAMQVFGMLADFSVTHGIDGRPSAVHVSIAPAQGNNLRHTLSTAESSFARGLLLTHFDGRNAQRSQVTPSADCIDRILKAIKDEGKNYTTKRNG